MKEILTNTLSILIAAMLLFIMVAPAKAASLKTMISSDRFQDESPQPANGTPPSTTEELTDEKPQPNLVGTFNVWYGDNQTFGNRGIPQKQINIVGNISGANVSSMTYKLNDASPVTTIVGSGSPRLENPGDFNISIEIDNPDLNPGLNTLLLQASGVTSKTITFTYVNNKPAQLPFVVDWSEYSNINQTAIVADGLWTLTADGVKTQITGYDRIIALGQRSWTDYEVLVPVTLHNWPVSGDGGVGIIVRWDGHYPDSNSHPSLPDGWSDMGVYGYYSNDSDPAKAGLAMWLNGDRRESTGIDKFTLTPGVTYLFKLRVETVNTTDARYSLKAWRQGQPEPAWDSSTFSKVYQVVDTNDKTNGGVLLVAHHANATFGNVNVCPLNGTNYTLSVNTSGGGTVSKSSSDWSFACGEGVSLTANPTSGWKFVRWQGDVNSTSQTIHTNIVKATNITAVFQLENASALDEKVYIPVTVK